MNTLSVMPPAGVDPEPFALHLPSEPGHAERMGSMVGRLAKALSDRGWKFEKRTGPRGFYFEGYGPAGARMMSEQKAEEGQALIAAILHASNFIC